MAYVEPRRAGSVKCLVWDLDRTVWRGALLDGDRPVLREGVADVIAELDRRGILQSVASANVHDEAWPWLEWFGLAPFLVAPEIHLGDKHRSVERIAARLHLRLADVAFIDDDPLERGLMRSQHPVVTVLDVDEIPRLADDPRFAGNPLTCESRSRREMVHADLDRADEEARCDSLLDFLQSCRVRFEGRPAAVDDIYRIVELAERTNRMNATGSHESGDQIRAAFEDPHRGLLVATMSDRFGDYGTVAAAISRSTAPRVEVVDGLWMSCRAGRRGLPAAFFTFLARRALANGCRRLHVSYKRTDDNRLAAFHLGIYGFSLIRSGSRSSFRLDLPEGIQPYEEWLEVSP